MHVAYSDKTARKWADGSFEISDQMKQMSVIDQFA